MAPTTVPTQVPSHGRAPSLAARPDHLNDALLDALVVVLYIAIAIVIVWHGFSPSTLIGNTGSDQPIQMWDLTYTPFALLHGHSLFITDYVNFPYGSNLLDNTTMTALGLLVAPVTLIVGAVSALTTALALAFCCSATAAYALARRFASWRPAAATAGLIYGFSPYLYNQAFVGHVNLAFVAMVPMVVLTLHELLVVQRGRPWVWGLVLGFIVVVQYFISNEVLATSAIVMSIGLLALLVIGHRHIAARASFALRGLVVAVGSAFVFLAYPLWVSFFGPNHLGGIIQPQAQVFREDLAAIIWPTTNEVLAPSSLTATSATFAHHLGENGAYLGIPLVILIVATTIWQRRSAVVVVAAVTGLSAFILSLGAHLVVSADPFVVTTGLPLPEAVLAHVTFSANIIPARFTLYLVLCASLLAAIGIDRGRAVLTARSGWTTMAANVVIGAICVVVVLPLVPPAPMRVAKVLQFPAAAIAKVPRGSVALFYPFGNSVRRFPQAFQAMSFMHFKIPGGDSLVPTGPHNDNVNINITRPSALGSVLVNLETGKVPVQTPALRARLRRDLRTWQIDSVLAVPVGAMPAAVLSTLTWLLGAPPTIIDGYWTWYGVRSLLAARP